MSQFFTFGGNHTTAHGVSLGQTYVEIEGDFSEARDKMVKLRGDKWSMQYHTVEATGAELYNLHKVDESYINLPEDMKE